MRKITILGSTGSIGTQSLDVIKTLDDASVFALAANSNITLLEEQIRRFSPRFACVVNEEKAKELKIKIADTNTTLLSGQNGLCEIAAMPESDTVVTGIVGIAGLLPTMEAIKTKKRICLANKETLVTAGDIVKAECKKTGAYIIPVDSEHSAIFQSMEKYSGGTGGVKRILLTASGGPFFNRKKEELLNVTRIDALKHPNWDMGAKITIDSATLMNKGLEVIEAYHLFGVDYDNIEVLVHRQSIVHSMVEFCDNAVIGQMGTPDMRLPIQYAITYPDRLPMRGNELDLFSCGPLTFEKPDTDTFRCLSLAYKAGKTGYTMPCVLNGANEAAVTLFLQGKIGFLEIAELVEGAMDAHKIIKEPKIEDILEADKWAREYVDSIITR